MSAKSKKGKVENGVRWVKIQNLTSKEGLKLNGKLGKVAKNELNKDGRFEVHVEGVNGVKLLKPPNVENIPETDLVLVQRLPCNGEGASNEELLFPKDHKMFQEGGSDGNCPALKLCGFPLQICKAKPRRVLSERGDYDNVLATWSMIEPRSGFAPAEWQSHVGPVYMYRSNGMADLTGDDVDLIWDFLSSILDEYGEGPDFDPFSWLNPAFFLEFAKEREEDEDD